MDDSLRSLLLNKRDDFQRKSTLDSIEHEDEEDQDMLHMRMQDPRWSIDRGAGFYQQQRLKNKWPALVESGRHSGRSRVKLAGVSWRRVLYHTATRDFFLTVVNIRLLYLLATLFACYSATVLIWAIIYYTTFKFMPTCFFGFNSFTSSLLFAIETQQTIGYGVRAPQDCAILVLLVGTHSVLAVLLDSIILGIVFARLSHPKSRGRTVLISDCACIARRDGVLKFMFRIADIQRTAVISPKVTMFFLSWGEGRTTAEGEHMPVVSQQMALDNIGDTTLLLPLTVEHTIDDRSPLCGQTQSRLMKVNAEIIVIFEGSTELGDMFTVRHSYLPSEMHWGHTFVRIIHPAPPGETQHIVNIARFHDVEPQPALSMMLPRRAEKRVLQGEAHTVPGRMVAGENTLVLSDDCCVTPKEGRWYLMFRLGDTFPGQMLDVAVHAYLYRWNTSSIVEGEAAMYDMEELVVSPVHVVLRFPVVLMHEICPNSPIAGWTSQEGLRQDVDAEIVVSCRGILHAGGESCYKFTSRTYPVLGCVKWHHTFAPVVVLPKQGPRSTATIDWANFHTTIPGGAMAAGGGGMGSRRPSTRDMLAVSGPDRPPPSVRFFDERSPTTTSSPAMPPSSSSSPFAFASHPHAAFADASAFHPAAAAAEAQRLQQLLQQQPQRHRARPQDPVVAVPLVAPDNPLATSTQEDETHDDTSYARPQRAAPAALPAALPKSRPPRYGLPPPIPIPTDNSTGHSSTAAYMSATEDNSGGVTSLSPSWHSKRSLFAAMEGMQQQRAALEEPTTEEVV